MLIEIILFLFLGVLTGIFTGLTPGIHVNLIGAFLITLSVSLLAFIDPIYVIIFIVAMAITHTYIDFIPSIYLGCPDTDTELSILPGHELLKKGQGYSAILLTIYGSLAAVFILILISYPAIYILSKIHKIFPILIPGLLALAAFFLISTEKNKINALIVFILTGILGLIVLNLEPFSIFKLSIELKQPLLPLLTGLFGASTLIISIKSKTKIPEQKITKIKQKIFKPIIGAIIASPICSFLPGLGSGQAAIIGNTIIKNQDKKAFLVLLGATNTLVMGFSFISLYIIARTRTGAALAIKEIMGYLSGNILVLILISILITGIISFFLTKFLAKFISGKITKINYTKLSLATLFVLALIVFIASGFFGLIVLTISALTGLYSISLGIKRTLMMGVLMIPTFLIYLV